MRFLIAERMPCMHIYAYNIQPSCFALIARKKKQLKVFFTRRHYLLIFNDNGDDNDAIDD